MGNSLAASRSANPMTRLISCWLAGTPVCVVLNDGVRFVGDVRRIHPDTHGVRFWMYGARAEFTFDINRVRAVRPHYVVDRFLMRCRWRWRRVRPHLPGAILISTILLTVGILGLALVRSIYLLLRDTWGSL